MRPGFVDEVYRCVRQAAVVDVAVGEAHRCFDGFGAVADVVVGFVARDEALQDGDGVVDGGFADIYFLEAAGKGVVFFKDLPVFFVGGGADAAQFAVRQRRFDEVGGVHAAAARRACADDGVDFVDEEDGVGDVTQFFQ